MFRVLRIARFHLQIWSHGVADAADLEFQYERYGTFSFVVVPQNGSVKMDIDVYIAFSFAGNYSISVEILRLTIALS